MDSALVVVAAPTEDVAVATAKPTKYSPGVIFTGIGTDIGLIPATERYELPLPLLAILTNAVVLPPESNDRALVLPAVLVLTKLE
jgi:hypothetical protein